MNIHINLCNTIAQVGPKIRKNREPKRPITRINEAKGKTSINRQAQLNLAPNFTNGFAMHDSKMWRRFLAVPPDTYHGRHTLSVVHHGHKQLDP